MTNINSPYGFIPLDQTIRKNTYAIASGYGTTINSGDPVALTGTGVGAYPSIQIGVTGSDILGIFGGCYYSNSNGTMTFSLNWPASTVATNIQALVYDQPLALFRAQMDGALAVTDYGNKTSFASGSGVLGVSGYTLSSSGIGTGTDFIIMGAYTDPTNSVASPGTYAQVVGYFRTMTLNYPFTAV